MGEGYFDSLNGQVTFAVPDPAGAVSSLAGEWQDTVCVLSSDDSFPLAFVGHDGMDARIESGAGGLILHAGRFFYGAPGQAPHMRLTPEGNLGIGIRERRRGWTLPG